VEGKVRSVFRQIVLAVAGSAILSGPALGARLAPCTAAHLIASWKHDGLWLTSAVVDPPISVDGHDLRYAGKLRAASRTYKIYYDDNTEPGSEAHDATQDLVVTTAAGKFLGLYNISDISDAYEGPIQTEGSDILFPLSKGGNGKSFRNRIHFGPGGAPKLVRLVFGYDLGFQVPEAAARSDAGLTTYPSCWGFRAVNLSAVIATSAIAAPSDQPASTSVGQCTPR